MFSTIDLLNNPDVQSKFCTDLGDKGDIIKSKHKEDVSENQSDSDDDKSVDLETSKIPIVILSSSAFTNFSTMFKFSNNAKIRMEG